MTTQLVPGLALMLRSSGWKSAVGVNPAGGRPTTVQGGIHVGDQRGARDRRGLVRFRREYLTSFAFSPRIWKADDKVEVAGL